MDDTYRMRLGREGEVVIPAAIRELLHLDEGSELVGFVDQGAFVVTTDDALEEEVHAAFANVDRSLVDELIGERDAEADGEDR